MLVAGVMITKYYILILNSTIHDQNNLDVLNKETTVDLTVTNSRFRRRKIAKEEDSFYLERRVDHVRQQQTQSEKK